jgi:hypothetical protein
MFAPLADGPLDQAITRLDVRRRYIRRNTSSPYLVTFNVPSTTASSVRGCMRPLAPAGARAGIVIAFVSRDRPKRARLRRG